MTQSRGSDHFARLYESSPDPWNLASSAYEAAKYDRTVRMLGGACFAAGLEVGCSVGVLTRRLAAHCENLLAIDIVDAPLDVARTRCADLAHVRFARMQVPQHWPNETFDLIVLSEILYFLSPDDIRRCALRVAASSSHHATILLVNWLGQTDDPCTGDQAAGAFITALDGPFRRVQDHRGDRYRIDRLVRAR